MNLFHGERLHNPFNLEINKNIHWLGTTEPLLDPVFVSFMSDAFGLRAGFLNLKNQIIEGFNTIAKLVPHYAPSADHNDVPAYIKALCEYTKTNADDKIMPRVADMKALGKAIITHEQGRMIYSEDQIDAALQCAGIIAGAPIQPTISDKPSHPVIGWLRRLLS